MKHNYALGIKKIIILWIVVFLGGYVLNSFFKKINSLDEGLKTFAKSHIVDQGFQIKYTYNDGKTFTDKYPTGSPGKLYASGLSKNMQNGQTVYGQGNSGLKQIDVSMIGNAPAPASVSAPSGCGGPKFGLTGKQMYPKMNNAKPFIHGGSFSSFWFRKLSKSECEMFKRGVDCTSKPQDYVSKAYLGKVNGYSKKDNGVLPVVSMSKHGMGCMALPVPGNLRRVVWNTGCKPSSGRGGVCTVGKGSSAVGYSGTGGAHTVLWSFPRRADTGKGARAKGQGVWHPSLPSQVAKGNNLSNWDKFGIPIEAGDGIPRKKKLPTPKPTPKPKPKPKGPAPSKAWATFAKASPNWTKVVNFWSGPGQPSFGRPLSRQMKTTKNLSTSSKVTAYTFGSSYTGTVQFGHRGTHPMYQNVLKMVGGTKWNFFEVKYADRTNIPEIKSITIPAKWLVEIYYMDKNGWRQSTSLAGAAGGGTILTPSNMGNFLFQTQKKPAGIVGAVIYKSQ